MISPYSALITNTDEDFQAYLEKVHLYSIFKDVFEEFADEGIDVIKGVVKFIAWAYSTQSDKLHAEGNNWEFQSKKIFEDTGLDDQYFEVVCMLKSTSVQMAAERLLNFQNDENWKNYCVCRDLRREMLRTSLSAIVTASGEINYEQKMKNVQHAITLGKMMQEHKQAYIQNSPKLKASIDALNKVQQAKNTVGPQTFAK